MNVSSLRPDQPDYQDVTLISLIIAYRHVHGEHDTAIYACSLKQICSSLIMHEDVVITANDPQVIEAHREGGMPQALLALRKLL